MNGIARLERRKLTMLNEVSVMSGILYISDLDGTLFDPESNLTDITAKKLNSLIEQGMNFTVATARSVYSVTPKMSAVNIM